LLFIVSVNIFRNNSFLKFFNVDKQHASSFHHDNNAQQELKFDKVLTAMICR
jgi:hypothetical protein